MSILGLNILPMVECFTNVTKNLFPKQVSQINFILAHMADNLFTEWQINCDLIIFLLQHFFPIWTMFIILSFAVFVYIFHLNINTWSAATLGSARQMSPPNGNAQQERKMEKGLRREQQMNI